MKKFFVIICFVLLHNVSCSQNNVQTKSVIDLVFKKTDCVSICNVKDIISASNFRIYEIWMHNIPEKTNKITGELTPAARYIEFTVDVNDKLFKVTLNSNSKSPNLKVHHNNVNPELGKNKEWFSEVDKLGAFYTLNPNKQDSILDALYVHFQK